MKRSGFHRLAADRPTVLRFGPHLTPSPMRLLCRKRCVDMGGGSTSPARAFSAPADSDAMSPLAHGGRRRRCARLAVSLAGSFDAGLGLDQAGHAWQPEFAREATLAGQPTSWVTLTSCRSMRPWPLSCAMWLRWSAVAHP
jgi:hypothetical protein